MNVFTALRQSNCIFRQKIISNYVYKSFTNFSTNISTKEHIENLVKDGDVVVFMKGTPDAPRCGFSNAVVQILNFHGVEKFQAHDVLSDEDLRQGVKDYSNWPTIPQVYFKGEFIGGCDIMLDMHKNGELIEELQKIGINSVLLDKDKKDDG